MQAIKRFLKTVLILAVAVIGGAIAYAFSGLYDVSVGTGHTAPTQWYLNTLRERSIARRAASIEVPSLNDSGMINAGAAAYDQGCAGCHGRPGRAPRDQWDPIPPALTRGQPDPAATYWVVRNGIKMSAMPAIPAERVDDATLWNIIAFLQTASSLTEGEYRQLVEPPPAPEPAPEPAPGTPPQPGPDAEADDDSGAEDESAGQDPPSPESDPDGET